jgi:23S rRNA (cytidine2498-2'-O)-methyltransferase
MLLTCQAGYEKLLGRELAELQGLKPTEQGPGWVQTEQAGDTRLAALAFAALTLIDPVELQGDSVNALAARIAEYFLTRLRGERIETTWPSGESARSRRRAANC